MSACHVASSEAAPIELRRSVDAMWSKAEMLDMQMAAHADMECIQDMSDASTDLASDLGSTDAEEALPSANHVLHLVDWDDTILPTTWLSRQRLLKKRAVASEEQQAQLASLAEAAASTLEAAASIGRVVIVTNAAEGW